MRSDFTYSKVKQFVEDLANLNSLHDPEVFLDEFRDNLQQYGSDFSTAVMADLHGLIKQQSRYFWNAWHRMTIDIWFSNNFYSEVGETFPDEYDSTLHQPTPKDDARKALPALALAYFLNDAPAENFNWNDYAKLHGWMSENSGKKIKEYLIKIRDNVNYRTRTAGQYEDDLRPLLRSQSAINKLEALIKDYKLKVK